jgi:hypothetical protein
MSWVRERTMPTERPPLVGEVCANFFAVRGCLVVNPTDSHGSILRFLDQNRCYFFQVAPQLYRRGWVDPVPDTLLLKKCRKWNLDLWVCSQELWPLDHRGGHQVKVKVTLQLTVSQSLCQGIEPTLRLVTRYYFLSEGCFLKFAFLSLWGALSDERSGLSFLSK